MTVLSFLACLGRYSHVASDGGVPGHGLGGQLVVAVRAVQEGFPPLAVDEVGLQDEA